MNGVCTMEPRTAIVTGASHGIGQYIARALAGRGMNLLLVARSEGELARFARELRSPDVKVAVAAVDLGGQDAARQVADAAQAELGAVDVLVNNAATEPQIRFHVLRPDEIEYVLRVDLTTPLLLSRLLLPGMLDRGYGRIVNVSSLAGHVSFPYTETYAAAKDGLTAFSRVLHSDYRQAGEGSRRHPPRDRQGHSRDRRQPRARQAAQGAHGLLPRHGPRDQPAQRRRQAHGRGRRAPGSRPCPQDRRRT